MKYLFSSLLMFSVACGGAAPQGSHVAGYDREATRTPKNPAKFEALPALPDEGPIAERPARMLKALQARGYNAVLQKDKSVLLTTEKFGVVIPTSTAHLCQFDLSFVTGKGVKDEASLVATLTKVDSYFNGTNFVFAPEATKFRVTARRATVVRNEAECAEIFDKDLFGLRDTLDTLGDTYGTPVFAGSQRPVGETTAETTIQLGNSAAAASQGRDKGPQGYVDYYYGMLESEGAEPTMDEDGDIRFRFDQGKLYVPVPKKVHQFRQFDVVSIMGEDAAVLSLETLRAACMDAMKNNVFVGCDAFPKGDRVRMGLSASAHVGRESDPRYNFRNMSAAVGQSMERVSKYVGSHK